MQKNEKMTSLSQNLRTNATQEENTLWYQYLRRYPIQFRRQCVFGQYIVDFYCSKALLVVELDGSQHYAPEGIQKDQARTNYLNALGIQVLRFSNAENRENLRCVCEQIDSTVNQRIQQAQGIGRAVYPQDQKTGVQTPHPPPFGGTFPPRGRFSERRNYEPI